MERWIVGALLLAGLLGISACGDEDDGGTALVNHLPSGKAGPG